jgi:hypothetical protein
LSKVNLIHGKTQVKSDFMQSRDAKTAMKQRVPVSVSIGVPGRGIKRIGNRMGSEDLCSRETDRAGMFHGEQELGGEAKTKNITG